MRNCQLLIGCLLVACTGPANAIDGNVSPVAAVPCELAEMAQTRLDGTMSASISLMPNDTQGVISIEESVGLSASIAGTQLTVASLANESTSRSVELLITCSESRHGHRTVNFDVHAVTVPDAGAANPTGFVNAGTLVEGRFFHTATRLLSGQVLIVGGETAIGTPTATVELFDPATNAFHALAPLPTPRSHHIAALLPSGKVLIAGGGRSSGSGRSYPSADVTASALIFDPQSMTFTDAAPMLTARSFAESASLPNGEVLVTGGGSGSFDAGNPLLADALFSAEIYGLDGGWRPTGSMSTSRYFHSMSSLPNGDVLIVAGANESNFSFKTSERYEVDSGVFVSGVSLNTQDRFRHAAAAMADGRIMIAAGKRANIGFLRNVEVFTPSSDSWRTVGPVPTGGNGATLTPLQSGDLLFVGGFDNITDVQDALVFNAKNDTWVPIQSLAVGRSVHTATLLLDGRVLIAGGLAVDGSALNSAELAVVK